jgi:AIPR protein
MASAKKGKHAPDCVQLTYQLLRNITSPDEKSEEVQSFIVNLPAREILKIGTKENLRGYLAEYNPRKRNRVHDAIRETIETDPERFIVRNSGFVITAAGVEVDDSNKILSLEEPSIINGAQSQGEIRAFFTDLDEDDDQDTEDVSFHVRATVIVDPDPDEVIETAIARNIVTPVRNLSEAGARSQLDELEQSIAAVIPGAKIRKNEAQSGEEFLDTRLVLQLARLLMPTAVSGNPSAAEKLRAYKNPEQCLTDFCQWERARGGDRASEAKYEFTVQIAPLAWLEYQRWQSHNGWNGHQIWSATKKGRAVKRDRRTGRVNWVSPAILFPLMGAMSEFAVKKRSGWKLEKPDRFKEEEMIRRTVSQFRAHQSNPLLMGRSEASYDALRIYPQTLVEVLRDMASESR